MFCGLVAPTAHAQMKWTDKGFANVNVGGQVGSHNLETNTTFDIYDETAQVKSTQKVGGGGLFDISAGYKVWSNLAVALGYSYMSDSADAAITAQIPDPAVFDHPRTVTASAPGLKHTENTLNIMGVWMVPVTDKVDVGVSFGPSIFFVSQELPGAISVTEPGPTVTGVTTQKVDKTAGGVNFGVDVTYLLTKRWGVGGLMRYTWGSVDIASDSMTVGGFQIGVGGRLRF